MSNESLEAFGQRLGLNFQDKNLFQQVFVHRSYLNEHRSFYLPHNERLEFLGDAVLELVVTEYLYRTYNKPEGELTNWRSALVRGEMLAEIATELTMEPHLLLSRGEQKSTGKARKLILANAFEALIGALYLDQDFTACREFITKHLISKLDDVLTRKIYIDAKSSLQEQTQERLNLTPTYQVLSSIGPDHDKKFIVGVYFGEREIARGEGGSKQRAEQAAAAAALDRGEEIFSRP
ncbi:ribonuclease III [Candidatus Berkelbacteria bacterium]|nr:ribonuclease III [Candidatus Berkelbacteria bacterium]